jgi:hypothetical protein
MERQVAPKRRCLSNLRLCSNPEDGTIRRFIEFFFPPVGSEWVRFRTGLYAVVKNVSISSAGKTALVVRTSVVRFDESDITDGGNY